MSLFCKPAAHLDYQIELENSKPLNENFLNENYQISVPLYLSGDTNSLGTLYLYNKTTTKHIKNTFCIKWASPYQERLVFDLTGESNMLTSEFENLILSYINSQP